MRLPAPAGPFPLWLTLEAVCTAVTRRTLEPEIVAYCLSPVAYWLLTLGKLASLSECPRKLKVKDAVGFPSIRILRITAETGVQLHKARPR